MRAFLIHYTRRRSLFHALDPLSKLAWVGAVAAVSLTRRGAAEQLALFALVLLCVLVGARVRPRELRGFVLLMAAFSAALFVVQLLVTKGSTPAFAAGPVGVTREALDHAGNVALRIGVFIGLAVLFVDSTDPHDLGNALTRHLRLPYRFALMLFLTLRLLHLLDGEIRQLQDLHRLRLYGGEPTLVQRLRGLPGFLSTLLARSIRRSFWIALSLESRGWGASERRTFVRPTPFGLHGALAVAVSVAFAALWIGLARRG